MWNRWIKLVLSRIRIGLYVDQWQTRVISLIGFKTLSFFLTNNGFKCFDLVWELFFDLGVLFGGLFSIDGGSSGLKSNSYSFRGSISWWLFSLVLFFLAFRYWLLVVILFCFFLISFLPFFSIYQLIYLLNFYGFLILKLYLYITLPLKKYNPLSMLIYRRLSFSRLLHYLHWIFICIFRLILGSHVYYIS